MRLQYKPLPKPNPEAIQISQRDASGLIISYIQNQKSRPYGINVNGRRYFNPTLYDQTGSS